MASCATHRRRRPPRVDYTRALSVELLASALDYLDQPDVLRTARVSKWWRAVAVAHPYFYRVIRSDSSPADYVVESSWTGHKKLHAELDDIANGSDGALYRVVVYLLLRERGYVRKTSDETLLRVLAKHTVPRLKALFPRLKALYLVLPDTLRPVIFDMLRSPAPVLEFLSLEFTKPKSYHSDHDSDDDAKQDSDDEEEEEEDEGTAGSDAGSNREAVVMSPASMFLPSDLLSGTATRLRSIDLSGVRLGNKPIAALSRVRNAHIDFRLPIRSLGLTPSEHFPALARLIIGIHEESISELGLTEGSLDLPVTLSSFCLRIFDDAFVEAILEDVGITNLASVSTVELDMVQSDSRFDWASFLLDLGGAAPHSMRIVYPVWEQRDFFTLPSDIALSVESADGLVRTVHWTEPEIYTREDAYDDDNYFTQFNHFAQLRSGLLCASLEDVTIAHDYLPALFALKTLTSLRRLEMDLDMFKAPFWKTLDTLDDPEEKRTLSCPVLETVVLRTSYSYTEVNSRELARFGCALGLQERPAEKRPRLLLLGAELSSAKYGVFHLDVFGEVDKVPLPAMRFRPGDGPNNYDPEPTDYDDYISDEEGPH